MPAWWDSIDSVSTFTWWMRWIGIVLTAVGAICGGLALVSSKRSDTLKAVRDAEVRSKALETEKALAMVRDQIAPRRLRVPFPNAQNLDPANTWQAAIWYKAGDDEAHGFAMDIAGALRSAGWQVDEDPRPTTRDETIDPISASHGPLVRPGITIVGWSDEVWMKLKLKVLVDTFTASGFIPVVIGIPRYPLVIIIGSKN